MRSTKIYFLIFIFLCGPFLTKAFASGKNGDSLFLRGKFYDAAIEYERQFFESTNAISGALALYGKAECYKQLGKFPAARRCLTDIPLSNLPDSIIFKIRYQLALVSYLSGNFEMADNEMKQLQTSAIPVNSLPKILQLKILTYNELNQYFLSHEILMEYINLSSTTLNIKDSLRIEADLLYKSNKLPKIRNPKHASIMSIFLPGLGQTYAGHPLEGIVSLTLNLSSLAVLVIGGLNAYYISGYVVGAGLFQKFYFGGQKRTESLVISHNYHSTRDFNDRVKKFLLSIH